MGALLNMIPFLVGTHALIEDGWMKRWIDEKMNGWVDEWMDGWMKGWIDERWMDG